MTLEFDGQRLELEYPCAWEYTLIGRNERVLRAAVADLCGGREHTLVPSKRSAGGRWVSLVLRLTVGSEAERLALFAALADHDDVRFLI